jgi:ADP-ribose pyrophosphatase YjhB (NUDIX family)
MTSQASQPPRPLVGVGAIVVGRDDKVLVGKRKGSHGEGESIDLNTVKMFDKVIAVADAGKRRNMAAAWWSPRVQRRNYRVR